EMLITRYFIGQAFAAHVYEQGGWPALDKAYDNPPVSTEQILHPEKYLGPKFDTPTRIEGGDPAAALGEGWKTVYANTMGEFLLRVHLTEFLGRKRATEVAAGWDGARYFICEKKGEPLFAAVISAWDTEQDALDFARAWAQWAGGRDGVVDRKVWRMKQGFRTGTDDGLVVTRIDGKKVLVVDGVPPHRKEQVLQALAAAKLIP
ncbi:MAG: hypothetical protein ACYTEG_04915, partial [Planctomycetota bacterium]